MSKIIQSFILLLITFMMACNYSISQSKSLTEVHSFIQLLIKKDQPTLADYEKYSGEGDSSELELFFELKECHAKGWENRSRECINYINSRWNSGEHHRALFLDWVREKFSTVGKSYKINKVESKTEGFNHELVEVEIGSNKFLLFHNTNRNLPTGLFIGITEINGKKISEYLED